MRLVEECRKTIQKIAFGNTLLPQEFTVGLVEPQSEVSVWLYGIGTPHEVTDQLTTACTAPLCICIAFDKGHKLSENSFRTVALRFSERDGSKRVLGEISLRFRSAISIGSSEFILFQARKSTNYCLPRPRLWAHYLLQAYSQFKRSDPSDIRMTLREQRAAVVTFIRPHPLYLASVGDRTNGNIFPMNLAGDLGKGYFGFALREMRLAAHLVERANQLAVSTVPLPWCSVASRLACNHKKESIDWRQLPFETKPSMTFGIPVPNFATRVREIQVEKSQKIGSHRFFVGRIVSGQVQSKELQACIVHGFYQFWRLGGDSAMLQASMAEDLTNKRGPDNADCRPSLECSRPFSTLPTSRS